MAQDDYAPIIIRKVRKHKHAAHHGGAWKVAYADFVTAMMAFFMLLWLLANPNKAQLKGLAEYFSPATSKDSPAATLTSSPGSQPGLGGRSRRAQANDPQSIGQPSAEAGTNGAARGGTADVPEAALRVLADEMMISIEPPAETPDAKRNVRVEPTRDGVRVHLVDSANRSMFKGPTAELNDYARQMLTRIARKLIKTGAQIAIEGHTDSAGGQSEANWHLSSERALAARSAMVAAGLTPDRFSEVVAKAGSEPIYPDRPDRPENRRITIVILAESSALPRDVSFAF
ncbi:flagellar motor protein MotB [Sphingomonas cavernae]|uniref:Flagellar motor protein MotB n=1 Tax=Sphingomonas cavernae TaxID=2320861 RepID=A0A418W6S9_9SPHN|nr:flagellar motor protein MotB [Sphingomonas cavernae]RJF85719.1 flagellar motor protein MotB [Sphingomonas cavernae]